MYPDAQYFILEYDNKIQAVANIELQSDGVMWVRGLNTAPWNMGPDKTYAHCGLSVMTRIVSFAIERGQKTIRLAADDTVANFYQKLGMQNIGEKFFGGVRHTVFEFDTDTMHGLINRFQINLSF